ncbi:amino acid permease [Mobilicoccus massiliensis]|uniref:amino acid permease n=1 Tax=Mobilicoccus massiliensis TaxID=1522310 RepID=UPI000AEB4C28|nr:amino acid permease [Mobilicoccus massiliensis]
MSSSDVPPAPPVAGGEDTPDGGLRRSLKNRHIQLIALGGAIGTGLFYGSASSIRMGGPSILLAYVVGGAIIFFVMRALGEMSVDTPTSGAFSHYAFRDWGSFAGFFSGWNYWFNYIAVSMAELTVVGTYVRYWNDDIPEWVSAAVFLVLVTAVNLLEVRLYGEFEFWFAIVKVAAIVAMIVLGLLIVTTGIGNGGVPTGISNLWTHGGFLPNGLGGMLLGLAVVMFSFGGVELIGITAGEADDPRRTIPRAINQVVVRILIFYVGALFVVLALYPWSELDGKASPFVEIFDRLGIPSAAGILNAVVLTAAISAYNSGLYSNGRMLHGLARQGNAPRYLARVGRNGAPVAGVLTSSAVTALAIVLLYLLPEPEQAFLYVLSLAMAAAVFNWSMIVITQMKFRRRVGPAAVSRLTFRMPWFPWANYLVLAFLAMLVVIMGFSPDFRLALIVGPVWLGGLYVAYRVKVARESREHRGTGAAA